MHACAFKESKFRFFLKSTRYTSVDTLSIGINILVLYRPSLTASYNALCRKAVWSPAAETIIKLHTV